jgi:hypothetical protein
MNTTAMDQHRATALLLGRLGGLISQATYRALAGGQLPPDGAAALDELERLGLQLQALGRVCSGHGALKPETLDLGVAVLQARAEWAAELARRSATLDGPAASLHVRVSAGVLKQALDLALGHALALGQAVQAEIAAHGVPALPTLSIAVRLPGQELFGVAPEALDELHWALLMQLAAATGLRLERQVDAHQVVLRLGFLPA